MQPREVDAREAAQLHQRDGQRVAHGYLGRGRGGGGQVEDAGLLLDPHVEVNVRILGQRRFGVARHRDERIAVGVDEGDNLEDFVRLARIGERQNDVLLRNHAQIAVEGLSGVEEEARRTGRGERGGDFAPHEARFAHTRHDAFAPAGENRLHGLHEAVAQRLFEVAECQHFGMQGPAGHLQNLGLVVVRHVYSKDLITFSSSPSGSMLGPSLLARSGSGCTSKK